MGSEVQSVIDRYKKLFADYEGEQARKAEKTKGEIDQQAGNNAQQAYISYMQNKKDMPEQLGRMGLSGGASETSLLKANTNYENRRGNIETERDTNKSKVDENLRSNLTAYKLNHDQNMEQAINVAKDREAQAQAREEARFASTISGYNTLAEVDAKIQDLKTRGVPGEWSMFYPYLLARRAEILNKSAQEAASASRASSGSSRGGGRSGGRGRGRSRTTTIVDEEQPVTTTGGGLGALAVAAARALQKGR